MRKLTGRKLTRAIGAGLLAAVLSVSALGCASGEDKNSTGTAAGVPLTTGAAGTGASNEMIDVDKYRVDLLALNYKDYVKTDKVKDLVIKKSDVTPSEEYVKFQINSTAMKALGSKEVQRTVEYGDTIILDYTGYINDIAFSGGSAKNAELGIGSQSFIDGFESSLVGKELEKEYSINVTFPEDYTPEPSYAGKPAVFKVTIHKITTVADADAETIKKKTGFDDYAAYTKDLDEKIRKDYKDNNIWRMYVEAVEGIKDHEGIATEYVMTNLSMMDMYALQYQVSRADILKEFYGFDSEKAFTDYMEPYAKQYAKQKLTVIALADVFGIVPSEQDYTDKVSSLAKEESVSESEINKEYSKSDLFFDIIYDKVFDKIYASEIVAD